MIREGYAPLDQANAFAFEKSALKAGKGLADRDSAACGNHAVPGNGLTARAGGHGASRGTSAAREAYGAGQLSVGDDTSLGDALNQRVDAIPGRIHPSKDSWKGAGCQLAIGRKDASEKLRVAHGEREPTLGYTGMLSPMVETFQFCHFRKRNKHKNSHLSHLITQGKKGPPLQI